ncbi:MULTISPECIES: VF_A0006 family four-cysteine protein [Photobacterium]|uniref:VF_A0006 family four-cysteine protein n=1 Tax=Photobacterium TaxID=657 RepID=UPI000662C2F7|nr:VF_A0006 family four-cysteine protein [Photobacterium swingsii]KMV30694.1 hypothetical protein AB733_10405 [Photobacterium swingsii]
MRINKGLSVALCLVASTAVAKQDKEAYQDCILSSASQAEDSAAASIMTNACHRLYIDNFMLSSKDQDYFQCLLDYLPDVKKRSAAVQVQQTCDRKHRSLFN